MKKLGKPLIALGVILLLVAFNMDTSVESGYGRVNNIGLMSRQSNYLILGGLFFLAGIIISVSSKSTEAVCPFCKEAINPAAILCKHCGREMTPQTEPICDAEALTTFKKSTESITAKSIRFLTLRNVAKTMVAIIAAILLTKLLNSRVHLVAVALYTSHFIDDWESVASNASTLLVITIAAVGILSNSYFRAAFMIAGICLSVITVNVLMKIFNEQLLPPNFLDLVVGATLVLIIFLAGRLARRRDAAAAAED